MISTSLFCLSMFFGIIKFLISLLFSGAWQAAEISQVQMPNEVGKQTAGAMGGLDLLGFAFLFAF